MSTDSLSPSSGADSSSSSNSPPPQNISPTATSAKRKHRTIASCRSELIDLLMTRKTRAKNFLHESANTEQILFATIAELQDCQLQTQLLETKLQALQKQKQLDTLLPFRTCPRMCTMNSWKSAPADPCFLHEVDSRTSSPTADSPVYQSPCDFASGRCDSSPPRHTATGNKQHTSAEEHKLQQQNTQQLIVYLNNRPVPIYRNIFKYSDLPYFVVAPNFRIIECNNEFLKGLPYILYGPTTIEKFLASGITLLDIESPNSYLDLFRMYQVLTEQGVLHLDRVVRCEDPYLAIDVTCMATFDSDPTAFRGRRMRHVTIFRRQNWKDPSLSIVQVRRALIGQDEPLPMVPRARIPALPIPAERYV